MEASIDSVLMKSSKTILASCLPSFEGETKNHTIYKIEQTTFPNNEWLI